MFGQEGCLGMKFDDVCFAISVRGCDRHQFNICQFLAINWSI